MDEVYDLLLWANAMLFVLSALMLAHRTRTIWATLPVGGKRFFTGLCILFVALAYAALEVYLRRVETGPRVLLTTIAMLGVVHGLWASRRDRA